MAARYEEFSSPTRDFYTMGSVGSVISKLGINVPSEQLVAELEEADQEFGEQN
jgi:hypothetical protein